MIENFQIEEMVEQTQRYVSYKAYNMQSGRKCLLKRYLVDGTSGLGRIEGWQDQFLQIIEESTRFEVPSLRTLIGGGLDPQDGNPFAVFEWYEVSSLSEVFKDITLDLGLTRQMSQSVLSAMGAMHQRGLIHGDISPQSIYYTDSEEKNPWVLNWDPIRSLRCRHGVNRFGMNLYVAPELSAGGQPSAASDFYALGKTIDKVAGVNAQEPLFAQWVDNLTGATPESRYADAQQALAALPLEDAPPQQVEQAPVEPAPVTPEPAPSRLLVGGGAPATPGATTVALSTQSSATAPLKTSAATTSAVAQPAGQVAPEVVKAPVKKSGGSGVVVGVLVALLALIGGGIYMVMQKGKDKSAPVVVNEPSISGNPSLGTSEASSEEVLDPEVVINASDIATLDKVIRKTRTVQGVITSVKVDAGRRRIFFYFHDDPGNTEALYIIVDPRKSVKLLSVEEYTAQYVGKEILIEGEIEYKTLPNTPSYNIYITKLRDIVIPE